MPLPKMDGVAPVVPDDFLAENVALAKAKVNNSVPSISGRLMASAATKARSILGDIVNTRLHLRTEEGECKKPQIDQRLLKHVSSCQQPGTDEVKQEPKGGLQVRRGSYSFQQLEVEDIDTEENPQLVAVYVKDIYKYLVELEQKTTIKPNFMEGYKIKPSMRGILVDWMVDVHSRFKLLPETLYLSISIMDRFIQVERDVTRNEFQLIGLTSMFIASKYEEMYSPEIHDFVYMSDKAYSQRDILRTEIRILKALDFNLGRPLPLHFLRRFTKAAAHTHDFVDVLHHTLSKYLMELSLTEHEFCHHPPSQLAAASLCLSLKILDESDAPVSSLWNELLIFYTGYTVEKLEPLMSKLSSLIIKSDTSKLQAIRKKYLASKFFHISALPSLKSPSTVAFLGQLSLKV